MSSKLNSDVCYYVYGWSHVVKALAVTAGLAEAMSAYRSVDGLNSPAGWLPVQCTPW